MYQDASGVYHPHAIGMVDCTNEQYHSGPGISKSSLDAISISALNYWDQYINPNREPREFKHCFAVGDGTHKLVLEPGTFESTYAVGFDRSAFPNALNTVDDLKQELSRQGLLVSGAKPELARRLVEEASFPRERIMMFLEADHKATMADRIAISAADYRNMLGMLTAISRHHTAGDLLRDVNTEQSFYWVDEAGRLRKCRSDAIPTNGQMVLDLKTTDDVSKRGFGRTIAQRRYHVQAAWYLDILRGLYGMDAPRIFAFIAVQKTRPFDVAVHYLTAEQIAEGRRLYQQDLARLDMCLSTGVWHGVDEGQLIEAELPRYAMPGYSY